MSAWTPPWAHRSAGLSGLHGLYGLSSRDWYKLAGLMALWSADDERGLISLAQQGDRKSLEQLFEHYRPQLVSFLRGKILTEPYAEREAIAEDIAQETLLKLTRNIGRFDLNRGVKFSTWMFQIARNTAIDRYRAKAARERRTAREETAAPKIFQSTEVEDITERVEVGGKKAEAINWSKTVFELLVSNPEMMQRFLMAMSPEQRQAFKLRHVDNLSYAEIGRRLGISENTAKNRVFSARNIIDREFLKQYGRTAPAKRVRRMRT